MLFGPQEMCRWARDDAGKRATVELPGVLPLHHRGMLRGAELNRHYLVHENPQSTAR